MVIKNPKGHSVVSAIAAVVVVVVLVVAGPIGVALLAGLNAVDCNINVFYGCSSGGGGGGAANATVGASCSSAPNSCGMTNLGTVIQTGPGTGSCNATPPPDSSCPVPTIPSGSGFYATPSTTGPGGSSTLTWNAANSTGCAISGDNGFTSSGGASGSVSTGALTQTTTFTLTCSDGATGPKASQSLKVIVDPHYKEI